MKTVSAIFQTYKYKLCAERKKVLLSSTKNKRFITSHLSSSKSVTQSFGTEGHQSLESLFLTLIVLSEGAHTFVFHVMLPHQGSALSTNLHALSISQPATQNKC